MGALGRFLRCIVVFAAAFAFAPGASASFHLFQIEQIFSNADGTVQFVVLHESTGANDEQFLGGHDIEGHACGRHQHVHVSDTTCRAARRPGAGC